MTQEKHDFQLSVDELRYRIRLAAHDESLAMLLKSQEDALGPSLVIRLSRAEAENLRDSLTTQLAAVGFDDDYSPNKQGRMLEKLIDKFCST